MAIPTLASRSLQKLYFIDMQFAREKTDALIIRAYNQEEILVGERRLVENFAMAPDSILDNWPPQEVDQITPGHIEALLALNPDIVILGTGSRLRFPPAPRIAQNTGRQIGFEAMNLGAACRTYNVLVNEGRRAILAVIFDTPTADD